MMPALTPCSCRYKHPSRDQHGAGAQHCHPHWGQRLQPAAAPDQRAARLRDHLHQRHPPLPRYSPPGALPQPLGLGEHARLVWDAQGVLPIPGTCWMNQPCAAVVSLQGGGNSGKGAALALPGSTWPRALSHGSCACIPGFLWLILSSFSFLFSSQLKAPRWQTPSSRPTPACSTMQVSNFASHSFPLSLLCSSPLFLGGERHHGVEHWTGTAYLGGDS